MNFPRISLGLDIRTDGSYNQVMRFSFLASKYPEFCALRAKSRPLALLWELGHGLLWACLLSLPGAVALWWVSRDDSQDAGGAIWAVIAPVLLLGAIGVIVKRYAAKKGGVLNASAG